MKKISLNDIDKSRNNDNGEYQLDPTEKYVINLEEELQFQTAIMTSFQIMGAPPALKNYHAWLFKNNFSCLVLHHSQIHTKCYSDTAHCHK